MEYIVCICNPSAQSSSECFWVAGFHNEGLYCTLTQACTTETESKRCTFKSMHRPWMR